MANQELEQNNQKLLKLLENYDQKLSTMKKQISAGNSEKDQYKHLSKIDNEQLSELKSFKIQEYNRKLTLNQEDLFKITILDS